MIWPEISVRSISEDTVTGPGRASHSSGPSRPPGPLCWRGGPLEHLAAPPNTVVDASQSDGLYSSIHTHTHARTRTHTHACTHARTHARTHTRSYLPVLDLPQPSSPLSLSENEASRVKQTQITAQVRRLSHLSEGTQDKKLERCLLKTNKK